MSVNRTIGPLVTIYGCGGQLGHVTPNPRTNFDSPYPKRLLQNLALIGHGVLEKMFELCERRADAGV